MKKSKININITDLSYEEIRELIPILQKRGDELRPAWYKQQEIEWKKREQVRAIKKKEFEKTTLPKIEKYIIENLKEGDIIKVKGARDGKGIRQFLKLVNNKLECRQILTHRSVGYKTEGYGVKLGQITEHQIDKVTHIKINNEFVRITDLIK